MARRGRSGLALVLVATAVAGAGGYAITTIAARGLGAEGYGVFAVFWGSLYLAVGALAGIQQELARASAPPEGGADDRRRLAVFALLAAAAVAVLGAVVVVLAAGALFRADAGALGTLLVVGATLSAAVAAGTGAVYGLRDWRAVALIIVLDVALRLVGVTLVAVLGGGIVMMAIGTVAPFVVMALLVAVLLRTRPARLDVGLSGLARQSVGTVLAGIGIAVLVSGFPLLIGVAATEPLAEVGAVVYGLTLIRAPLVVGVLALQSYLVVVFRTRHSIARVLLAAGGVAVLGGLFTLLVLLVGAPIVSALGGADFAVAPASLAGFAAASTATAVIAVTGAAVLARSRHRLYVAGWTIAAVVATVLLFAVPGTISDRVVLALSAGPVVGVLLHLVGVLTGHPTQGAQGEHGADGDDDQVDPD